VLVNVHHVDVVEVYAAYYPLRKKPECYETSKSCHLRSIAVGPFMAVSGRSRAELWSESFNPILPFAPSTATTSVYAVLLANYFYLHINTYDDI